MFQKINKTWSEGQANMQVTDKLTIQLQGNPF